MASQITANRDVEPLEFDEQEQIADLLAEALNCIGVNEDFARRSIEQALTAIGGRSLCKVSVGGLPPWQRKKVADFIEANLDQSIKIERAATLVQLTPNYFSRAFKITFGEPFSQYLISRRIGRAKKLLLATDLPICQIAIDCGLSDQSHLSRLFRRDVGVAPAAWRRAHSGRHGVHPESQLSDFADKGFNLQE